MARAVSALRGIYAIVNGEVPGLLRLIEALLDGGVRIVQYRAKRGVVPADLLAIREATSARSALLFVNDDWRAAHKYGADGAHLGPQDAARADLAGIRRHLSGRLLGLSCATVEEAHLAQEIGADYIGVGPVFATDSKADAGVPIGLGGLRTIVASTTLPVAAIGGITLETIPALASTGAAMAAMISAFSGPPDPRAAAERLVGAWPL
ncbi:MAG: thiamine phosphate synthase [Vulcanimicrobiaceae bacterium]